VRDPAEIEATRKLLLEQIEAVRSEKQRPKAGSPPIPEGQTKGIGASVAPRGAGSALFRDAQITGAGAPSSDPAVMRERFVKIDSDALARGDPTAPGGSKVLVLNLFEDAVFTAILERVEFSRSGSQTLFGRLDGIQGSSVMLVVKAGVVIGDIRLPRALYQLGYVGDGVHAIRQIDPSAFPDDEPPAPPEGAGGDSDPLP
jgi:hypothetical protein